MRLFSGWSQLLRHPEAGAGFVGKLVVAVDGGFGKFGLEPGHQLPQRGALGGRARVAGLPIFVVATYVAHTDGVPVVALAVGAGFLERAALVDAAV